MNISITAKVQQIVTSDHSVSVTLVSEKPKLNVTLVSQGTDLDNIKRSGTYNITIAQSG